MHPLENCGFVKDAEKWFMVIRDKYAFHVYGVQNGWSAGVARKSDDFELTDVFYQTLGASKDVIWGKKTYDNPVAAALAAVQFALHFGFVENCDEELESLSELIKKEIENHTEQELTDEQKREKRIQESMEKGVDNWKE